MSSFRTVMRAVTEEARTPSPPSSWTCFLLLWAWPKSSASLYSDTPLSIRGGVAALTLQVNPASSLSLHPSGRWRRRPLLETPQERVTSTLCVWRARLVLSWEWTVVVEISSVRQLVTQIQREAGDRLGQSGCKAVEPTPFVVVWLFEWKNDSESPHCVQPLGCKSSQFTQSEAPAENTGYLYICLVGFWCISPFRLLSP